MGLAGSQALPVRGAAMACQELWLLPSFLKRLVCHANPPAPLRLRSTMCPCAMEYDTMSRIAAGLPKVVPGRSAASEVPRAVRMSALMPILLCKGGQGEGDLGDWPRPGCRWEGGHGPLQGRHVRRPESPG